MPKGALASSYSIVGIMSLSQYADTVRASMAGNSGNSSQALISSAGLSPSASWAVTLVGTWYPVVQSDYPAFGVCVSTSNTSGTGTVYTITVSSNGSTPYLHQEAYTPGQGRTVNNNETSGAPTVQMAFGTGRVHLRLLCDTVNLHFQVSSDGFNWTDWNTTACPSGLSYYGFMMGSSGGGADYGVALIHSNNLITPITYNITAATNASPSVVTIGAHSIQPGDIVAIQGVVGATGLNSGTGNGTGGGGTLVTAVTSTTITTSINTPGAYSSGGIVTLLSR